MTQIEKIKAEVERLKAAIEPSWHPLDKERNMGTEEAYDNVLDLLDSFIKVEREQKRMEALIENGKPKGYTWVTWRSSKDNPQAGKYIVVKARGAIGVGLYIGYDSYVILKAEVVKNRYVQSIVVDDTFMEGHEWMYLDALKQKPLRSDSPFFIGGQIDTTKIK